MPPSDCPISNQYSLPVYQKRRGPQSESDTEPSALCVKAKAKGFARIVVIEQGANNAIGVHTISCGVLGD
jgi:hypothetical protein